MDMGKVISAKLVFFFIFIYLFKKQLKNVVQYFATLNRVSRSDLIFINNLKGNWDFLVTFNNVRKAWWRK